VNYSEGMREERKGGKKGRKGGEERKGGKQDVSILVYVSSLVAGDRVWFHFLSSYLS
jgi:hypothetical protein